MADEESSCMDLGSLFWKKKKPVEAEVQEIKRCEVCQAPISSIELECSHGLMMVQPSSNTGQ